MQQEKKRQVLERAWADPAFKQQLLDDPVAVLRAAGITVPDGVQVRVVEDTRELVHFLLPARPAALADGALEQVAGGLPDSFGSIAGHLAAPRPGALSPICFVSGVVPWK